MQKNSITNKITPCCGLPFSVAYWWVSNLTLNSEADRQFIISKISQDGIISIDAWKVIINSGTLEADSSLTKAEFLAWFDCRRQLNCEQLKLIIEGYKVGNYDPTGEYGVGWTELYIFEEYNGKLIKKITGYVGGVGVLPELLNDRIGLYLGDEIFTDNKDLAIDFKGENGASGTAQIPDWQAISYVEKSMVIYENSIWIVNEGETALATDIPGVSEKWINIGGISEESLKQVLASQGGSGTVVQHGNDLSYASTTASNTTICNLNYLEENQKINKVIFQAMSAGSINIYKVNAGAVPQNGNTITKVLIKNAPVVAGTNEIILDVDGVIGDMIGINTNGVTVGYTDGGAGKYFDASQTTVGLTNGHIAYYFESLSQGNVEYPIDALKETVKYSAGRIKEVNSLNKVDWIDLKGQSNALGVGYTAGLLSSPFNTQPFDWEKEFSRVFIWNPQTNNFENIKIGVNNMASWDANYTIGEPTNQSTFGAEVGIAIGWLQTHKFGELYIFKNVGDGQPIAYFQKGGAFYAQYLDRKQKAEKWLEDRGKVPVKKAFVWVQGEADMFNSRPYYLNQLKIMSNDMIEDGFMSNDTFQVITKTLSGTGNYSAEINLAKDDYILFNKYAKPLNYTNNFNADNIHLNTLGQFNLGIDSFKIIYSTDKITPSLIEGKINWTF
jgi:hypothetical protein